MGKSAGLKPQRTTRIFSSPLGMKERISSMGVLETVRSHLRVLTSRIGKKGSLGDKRLMIPTSIHILFIDEAYTLTPAGKDSDFGKEAVEILLKRMEDKKGQFFVIVAGYPNEMKNFFNSNPGLKSRFTHNFEFEDYQISVLKVRISYEIPRQITLLY